MHAASQKAKRSNASEILWIYESAVLVLHTHTHITHTYVLERSGAVATPQNMEQVLAMRVDRDPFFCFKHLHLLKVEWTFCIYVLYEFGILIENALKLYHITPKSTTIHMAICLSFSFGTKHAHSLSLSLCTLLRRSAFGWDGCFTNSKENWPFHNTFESHSFVYLGEFIHTMDATDVLKMLMWLFGNWNFRAHTHSHTLSVAHSPNWSHSHWA